MDITQQEGEWTSPNKHPKGLLYLSFSFQVPKPHGEHRSKVFPFPCLPLNFKNRILCSRIQVSNSHFNILRLKSSTVLQRELPLLSRIQEKAMFLALGKMGRMKGFQLFSFSSVFRGTVPGTRCLKDRDRSSQPFQDGIPTVCTNAPVQCCKCSDKQNIYNVSMR